MVGQINYPIGEDEIPRRLAALTQKLEENNAAVVQTVTPIVKEALTARSGGTVASAIQHSKKVKAIRLLDSSRIRVLKRIMMPALSSSKPSPLMSMCLL